MTAEQLLAFALFSFVSAVTPGPNNFFALNTAAVFGWRRALPVLFGVCGGFYVMLVAVGAGLIGVFKTYPRVHLVLKVGCIIYLLYLAWKIASAPTPDAGAGADKRRAVTFWQMVLFQWINPKAWAMALTAFSVYVPPSPSFVLVLGAASVFSIITLPSVGAWVVLGAMLRMIINAPGRLRAFNITMAVLLIASLYPIVFG